MTSRQLRFGFQERENTRECEFRIKTYVGCVCLLLGGGGARTKLPVHRELGHPNVDGTDPGERRNGRADRAAAGAIIAD